MRAEAGVDLVETVRRLAPDLVVIDMALPDRDALEGVKARSGIAPNPIVMFAENDDPASPRTRSRPAFAPTTFRASRSAT